MILITGGAFQGKGSFAFEKAGLNVNECQGGEQNGVADGLCSSYEAAFDSPVILHYHEYVKRLLREGLDPASFTGNVIEKNPNAVITVDELGCGIVPVDVEDRRYRETSGRMAAALAAGSQEVYRMVCGLPMKIKEGHER